MKRWGIIILCMPGALLPVTTGLFAQQCLINGNMSDSTGWTVYHQGSAAPASYTFNYTTQTPLAGVGGCLRITSPVRSNILFWQKLSLKVGRSYVVDGAFKTGTAASSGASCT